MQVLSPRFNHFVRDFTQLVDKSAGEETQILGTGRELLADLLRRDDWLAEQYAQPHPQYYQQYLLHAGPGDRFSVVSFVWVPGQKTPIHSHTVWALIGILRGGECAEAFDTGLPGEPMRSITLDDLVPGTVESISPHRRHSSCFQHLRGSGLGQYSCLWGKHRADFAARFRSGNEHAQDFHLRLFERSRDRRVTAGNARSR